MEPVDGTSPQIVASPQVGYQHSSIASMNLDAAVDFSWENMSYAVQVKGDDGSASMKTLLHSMSGTARGGRVLAIMGPSGAGKTTLMSGIIGRLQVDEKHKLDGCVFLNDTVFTERYKKLVSFVAQDDIVMGKETPAEAFYFSCRVRLGLSHEEATARTEDTLTRLHLQKCRDTYLGVPGLVKGVSGGEKKRTNIGNELITNPYVILLDEPTTGLDSVNAMRVGQLLHDLAHEDKRTVMCTIHSPSSELFAVFDDLLLLAKGHVIYHGPTTEAPDYFASIGYPLPRHTNPSEYFMNVLQLPELELMQLSTAWEQYRISPQAQTNGSIAVRNNATAPGARDAALEGWLAEKGSDFVTELTMLTARSWRQFVRDPGATYGRLVQTLFFSLLVGLFFFGVDNTRQGVQDRAGVLFICAMNNVLMSGMSGLSIFPPERAVFLMEQSSENYSAFTYSLAKTAAELPFQIGFPVLFASISYFMIGLAETPEAFFTFLLFAILSGNTGYSLGLAAASVFPASDVAFAVMPIVIFPMMIVGGLFANTDRLEPYWIWFNYMSIPRHVYVGMFLNEFESLDTICSAADTTCSFKTGQDVIKLYGFTDNSWVQSMYALIIYIVGLKLVAALSLWYQGRSRRGNLAFSKNLENRELSSRATSASALSPRVEMQHEPMRLEQLQQLQQQRLRV